MNYKIGIIGGGGYTAGELLRLLIHHPQVTIDFVLSNSQNGKKISSVHEDLVGEIDLFLTSRGGEVCSALGRQQPPYQI